MNISKHKDKYRRRRRSLSLGRWLLVIVGLGLLSIVLSTFFGPTSRIVQEQHKKSLQKIPQRMLLKMVELRDLLHEHLMHRTIRDCLPLQNKKCKTFVPEPMPHHGQEGATPEKVQRVALIVPPGKLATGLYNHMNTVADEYNSRDDRKEPKIDVFQTSHVPPYGYGKSHGLTKIVKLMPQPILLQVTDALKSLLGPTQNIESISFEDLQVGLLQMMRFHCRLSHVAAHTASLSIDSKTLVNATKLGLALRDYMTPGNGKGHVGVDEDTAIAADDDEIKVLFDQESIGASILTRLSEKTNGGENLLATLDDVLQQEMKRTKDMSVWPCPSFWDAPASLQLSDLTKQLARALSPDCSDPYVSCFVQKDKCEAAGDAICKK